MTRTVRLRDEAERDLTEAAFWYQQQQPGLGQEFLDEASRSLRASEPLRENRTILTVSFSANWPVTGRGVCREEEAIFR